MRTEPPPNLVELLKRTGLATDADLRRAAPRTRRLARGLPLFESVWGDALVQARALTSFQAGEIEAGRGERLRVGPYLLREPLAWPDYVASYRARRADNGAAVRLAVIEAERPDAEEILLRLQDLAAARKQLSRRQLAPITDVGTDDGRIWAASPWVPGRPAGEWLIRVGRFTPLSVLHVAREMLSALATLERAGVCHGDPSTGGLILSDDGGVTLVQPGLRAIVRPHEGYAQAELRPDAYDYLAPERIAAGTPPDRASDLYACAGVWWHLLCGRPPLAGGDALTKLRSAEAARVPDPLELAPDTPPELAALIGECMRRDPTERPEPARQLLARLRSRDRAGQRDLVRLLRMDRGIPRKLAGPVQFLRRATRNPASPLAAAVALVAALGLWLLWRDGRTQQTPVEPNRLARIEAAAAPVAINPGRAHPRVEHAAATGAPDGAAGLGEREAVQPAQYQAPVPEEVNAAPAGPATGPSDLVFDTEKPVEIGSLRLEAGQRVCASPGRRAAVLVPPGGLPVDAENVRFERIDFVGQPGAGQEWTLIHVRAGRATFEACTFRGTGPDEPTAAVRWTHPPNRDDAERTLSSGRLAFRNCVVYGLGAAVECRTSGARAVELVNVLHVASGPLVRLDHCPEPDEPIRLRLTAVTLRETGPVLECRYEHAAEPAGEIVIEAARCVAAPGAETPLLRFDGPRPPEALLGNLRWEGQGSLVVPETPIAVWRGPDGQNRALDETAVSIAGLVRSRVEFAGPVSPDATASLAVRWQAPLATSAPPGVDPSLLPEGTGGRNQGAGGRGSVFR
jgi:eukaryotic-like serine/threonine-protein kinase